LQSCNLILRVPIERQRQKALKLFTSISWQQKFCAQNFLAKFYECCKSLLKNRKQNIIPKMRKHLNGGWTKKEEKFQFKW